MKDSKEEKDPELFLFKEIIAFIKKIYLNQTLTLKDMTSI